MLFVQLSRMFQQQDICCDVDSEHPVDVHDVRFVDHGRDGDSRGIDNMQGRVEVPCNAGEEFADGLLALDIAVFTTNGQGRFGLVEHASEKFVQG